MLESKSYDKKKEDARRKDLLQYLWGIIGTPDIENMPLTADNITLFKQYFELIDISGKGSFGIVIKVLDKRTSDYAAIKVYLSPDHSQGYQRPQPIQ